MMQVEVSEIVSPPHDSLAPPSRYNFWKYKYPYPRLSRFSISAPSSGPPSPIVPAATLDLGEEVLKPMDSTAGSSVIAATPSFGPLLTMPGLIICCILSLLIGSLLRSLLSEADYVVYLPVGADHPSGGEWRELKRLAEWNIGWGTDLVIAIARR
jgi:hypothetical protein